MGQDSLGTPRSLDSEILIDVETEPTDELFAQTTVPDEELEDTEMWSVEEEAAGIDIENIEADFEEIDEYGEQADYSNEYLTVSSKKATNPPAISFSSTAGGRNAQGGSGTFFTWVQTL